MLFLAGCSSTPDLSGWAQNSAELANAINSENKEVLQRLDTNIAEIQLGGRENWTLAPNSESDWRHNRDIYQTGSGNVSATLTTMVLYADSLSALASAGETGKDAIGKMTTSLNKIAGSVGQTFPLAGAAVEAAKALAEAWTRVQAQDTLAKAMLQTQPQVTQMTTLIVTSTDIQKGIVRRIATLEKTLARQAAGQRRMTQYRSERDQLRADAADPNLDPIERTAKSELLESLENRFRKRERKIAAAIDWKNARIDALTAIALSAAAWRDSHTAAANALSNCGGLRSLRVKCGNFTAENLKLAAGRIRSILDANNSAPAQ